jgi:hypothetical protein
MALLQAVLLRRLAVFHLLEVLEARKETQAVCLQMVRRVVRVQVLGVVEQLVQEIHQRFHRRKVTMADQAHKFHLHNLAVVVVPPPSVVTQTVQITGEDQAETVLLRQLLEQASHTQVAVEVIQTRLLVHTTPQVEVVEVAMAVTT